MTLSITTLSTMTLSHYAECRCADCRNLFSVMLSVIMLSVVMMSVIMMSVIKVSVIMLIVFMLCVFMLSVIIMIVMASIIQPKWNDKKKLRVIQTKFVAYFFQRKNVLFYIGKWKCQVMQQQGDWQIVKNSPIFLKCCPKSRQQKMQFFPIYWSPCCCITWQFHLLNLKVQNINLKILLKL